MTTNDDKAVLILNDLLLAARDAEKGFQTAADIAQRPELVELFAGFSLQRAKFAKEIEARIRTLRATPVKLPNPAAAAHRGWMELKTGVESNETHALLAECERGEDVAVKAWATAVQDPDLDGQTRQLIQTQYELVQAAHDRIKQLRDSADYAYR
jgi:uncharacterized protein (TIGR02284 family)